MTLTSTLVYVLNVCNSKLLSVKHSSWVLQQQEILVLHINLFYFLLLTKFNFWIQDYPLMHVWYNISLIKKPCFLFIYKIFLYLLTLFCFVILPSIKLCSHWSVALSPSNTNQPSAVVWLSLRSYSWSKNLPTVMVGSTGCLSNGGLSPKNSLLSNPPNVKVFGESGRTSALRFKSRAFLLRCITST